MCETTGDPAATAPREVEGVAVDPTALEPVDEVHITVLVDNVFALLTSDQHTTRYGFGPPSAPAPQFESGLTSVGVVGGLHLNGPWFGPVIAPTLAALSAFAPELAWGGHCTGWRAQNALATALPSAWVPSGSGTTHHLISSSA